MFSYETSIMDKKVQNSGNSETEVNTLNDDERVKEGEGEIKKFDDVFPDHKLQEDIAEIASTDDV